MSTYEYLFATGIYSKKNLILAYICSLRIQRPDLPTETEIVCIHHGLSTERHKRRSSVFPNPHTIERRPLSLARVRSQKNRCFLIGRRT